MTDSDETGAPDALLSLDEADYLRAAMKFGLVSGNPGLELVAAMVAREIEGGVPIEDAPSAVYLAELTEGETVLADIAAFLLAS
ncbi:hypothetical protein [Senegalimassilia anaerobia]|uniref:hypothetical protein n=1 Tax=Senegalimassilia anaerobia TaxID=1473216 RepID=UPI0026EFC224|nr:hypothetical protein [Senegalimassilia anaerobia]